MKDNRKISLLSASSLLAFAMFANSCGVWNNPQFGAVEELPDLVLFGQPNFGNIRANASAPTAATLATPNDQIKVGTRWFVSDSGNNRILIYEGSSETASLVLGQQDFVTSAPNAGRTRSASTLSNPNQLASDGTRLAVADYGNNRVLIWNTLPTRNQQPADVVIGQPDFTSGTANPVLAPTAATLYSPGGVTFVGSKLIISDGVNNRVLVYNSVPAAHGAAADVVIGQADFVSGDSNRGGVASAQSLKFPSHISTNGTRLVVADSENHRVLIWNTVPTVPNVDADVVLGQPDFVTTNAGTTQSGFSYPAHGVFAGAAFYVLDYTNNRVLYWTTLPASGAAGAASGVIGQANYTSGSANRGGAISAAGIAFSRGLAIGGGRLRIAEIFNHRLLEFSSLPTGSGDVASAVYGQPSMTVGNPNQKGVSHLGVDQVGALCVSRKHLIVGDVNNNRFLVFDKLAKASGAGALAVIGQPDFESKSFNQGLAAPTARTISLGSWSGCAVDDQGRLYLADTQNHRILIFNEVPTTNNAAADFVLGQDTFATATSNLGADGLGWIKSPRSLMVHGNQLFVGDSNCRALIFNLPITANHPLASVVVGQANTTTVTAARTQVRSGVVYGVHTDGTRFFLNDSGNNRVLVYNSIPTTTGTAADYVIGRPDFTSMGTALTATGLGSSLQSPSLGVVDGFFFVPDRSQNRILGYPIDQLANGMAATRVIGQADYVSKSTTLLNAAGTGFENLNLPTYFLVDPDGQFIWIGETGTHRVLRIKRSAFWNYVH